MKPIEASAILILAVAGCTNAVQKNEPKKQPITYQCAVQSRMTAPITTSVTVDEQQGSLSFSSNNKLLATGTALFTETEEGRGQKIEIQISPLRKQHVIFEPNQEVIKIFLTNKGTLSEHYRGSCTRVKPTKRT